MRWPLTSSPDGVSRWLPAPPWLVVWVGWTVWDLPRFVDSWRAMWAVTTGAVDPAVAGQPWAWTIQLVQGTRLAVEVALVGSLAVLLVPALRGRWVEHRWRLGPSSPGAGAVAEITAFVQQEGAAVVLRWNLRRADQLAFAYPGGFRSPRLAVFAGLVKLWRSDRAAAEAVLRHELAHLVRGDHLAGGAGSPVPGLVRGAAPVVLGLALLPVLGPDPLGLIRGFVWFDPFALAARLVLPVGAMWLSELDADRAVVCGGGSSGLARAVAGSPSQPARRRLPVSLLRVATHPPMGLRRHALASPRRVGLAVGPAFPVLRLVQFVPLAMGVVLAVASQVDASVADGWAQAVDLVGARLGSVARRSLVDLAFLAAWTTWFVARRGAPAAAPAVGVGPDPTTH